MKLDKIRLTEWEIEQFQIPQWTIAQKWLNKLLIEQNIIEQKNWTNIVQLTIQWQAYQVLKKVLKFLGCYCPNWTEPK